MCVAQRGKISVCSRTISLHAPQYEAWATELGKDAGESLLAMPKLFQYLGKVILQDFAAGLAAKLPEDHIVVKFLRNFPRFRWKMPHFASVLPALMQGFTYL